MPTATEPAPTQDVPARGLFSSKASAISIVVASIATLAIVFWMLHSSAGEPAQTQSVPAQPNTVSQWVVSPAKPTTVAAQPKPTAAAQPNPSTVAAPPELSTVAAQPEPAAFVMDDHGFVDTTARCDSREEAVAIARTARAAMVVCRDSDGTYTYSGIRLSDGASLRVDDVRVIPTGFEAHNDGTTYRLSQTEMVVIDGENLVSRDAIVEYRAG